VEQPDARLIKLLVRAHRFNTTLVQSDGVAFAALAVREGVSRSYFTRLVRLSHLAPDITQAILDGRQPRDLGYRIHFIKVIFHPIRCRLSETVLNGRRVDLCSPAPRPASALNDADHNLVQRGPAGAASARSALSAGHVVRRVGGRAGMRGRARIPAALRRQMDHRCDVCGTLSLVTAAGRPDELHTVRLACKAEGRQA
jgi:hypothetical protein